MKDDKNLFLIGAVKEFRSSLSGRDGSGILVRQFTGERVTIVEDVSSQCDPEVLENGERMYRVEAQDGTIFAAWLSELDDSILNPYERLPEEGVQTVLKY